MNLANMLRTILLSAALFFSYDAQADGYLDKIFQGNVRLGEPLMGFRATHDKAIIMRTISEKEGSYDLGEMPSRTELRTYYFRKGRLVGYMKFIRAAQLDAEHRLEEASVANPEKSGEFVQKGISQGARGTQNLQMETIQVVNWKSKATPDLELYTVDSPNEITVIAFEPSQLSWKDFFVGPEIKDKLEASRQRIDRILSDTNTQKQPASSLAQALSAPKSSPTPIASPISTVTVEKKVSAITETKSSSHFPIIPVAIIVVMITGVVVFLMRSKS